MNHRQFISFALLMFGAVTLPVHLAHAQAKMPMLVGADWLSTHLNDPNLIVLAVSSNRNTYAAGHIPGARYLELRDIVQPAPGGWNDLPPLATLKSTLASVGVGNRSRIVLYGENKGLFAARAYVTLDYLGLGNQTAILDGGLEKWRAERRDIATDLVTPKPSTLEVKAHPEIVIDLPMVMKASSTHNLPIIDARSPADYAGKSGGVGAARTGHIPGAKNLYWMDTLAGSDIPTLKSTAEIRSRYLATGLKPGAKVIVYCRSGMQASFDYFTLKLSGFHPILYPGSFAQWVSAFGTPVETSNN